MQRNEAFLFVFFEPLSQNPCQYTAARFLIMGQSIQHRARLQQTAGEKGFFCEGISRVHRKSFKPDLKRKRDKTRLTRDEPGGGTSVFEG